MKLRGQSSPTALAIRVTLTFFLCCLVVGCGGGGFSGGAPSGGPIADGGVGGTGGNGGAGTGGGGGVGGTGVVALGTIASASSEQIVVNMVAFDTTPATAVRIDDSDTTLAELRDGMLVLVEGYKDTATQKTEAEKITYRSNVRGPLESISADCKSAVVLGQPIMLTARTQPALAGGACELTLGELLDVSGLVIDAQRNTISASFVRRMATPAQFQVTGVAANVQDHELTLGTLKVDYEHAQINPAAGSITPGSTILVKGQASEPHTLRATAIDVLKAGVPAAPNIEAHLEGFIADLNGTSFKISGQLVNAGGAVRDPPTLVLSNGIRVEVEGRFDAHGVVAATHIEAKSSESD